MIGFNENKENTREISRHHCKQICVNVELEKDDNFPDNDHKGPTTINGKVDTNLRYAKVEKVRINPERWNNRQMYWIGKLS